MGHLVKFPGPVVREQISQKEMEILAMLQEQLSDLQGIKNEMEQSLVARLARGARLEPGQRRVRLSPGWKVQIR